MILEGLGTDQLRRAAAPVAGGLPRGAWRRPGLRARAGSRSAPSPSRMFEADWQRAITTFDGFVRDNLSWLGAWDFELSAVRTPVRLVYGEGDRMVPTAHGEWLHERLAAAANLARRHPAATARPPPRLPPSAMTTRRDRCRCADSACFAACLRRLGVSRRWGGRRPWQGRVDQAYADSAHALEVARLGRGLAELAAQPRQVHVDGAVGAAPSACCHTSVSRVRLLTTSPARSARASSRSNSRRASSSWSPARVAVRVGSWISSSPTRIGSVEAPPRRTPHHRADAGGDLVQAERLHDVVVGARVERPDHRGVVVDGGDHDDRHRTGRPDHPDHGQAVDVGQPQVEQHEVGSLAQHRLQPGDAGAGGVDVVAALAQALLERGTDRRIVLDHEDAGHVMVNTFRGR